MKNHKKAIHNADKQVYSHIIKHAQSAIKNNYPDGLTGFAETIGENNSTVRIQFNPHRPEQPTLYKFLKAIELCHDTILMNAVCALANGSFSPCHDSDDGGDLMGCLTEFASNSADNIHQILEAIKDGRISEFERLEIANLVRHERKMLSQLENALARGDV